MKVIDNQGRIKDVGLKGDQGDQGETGPAGAEVVISGDASNTRIPFYDADGNLYDLAALNYVSGTGILNTPGINLGDTDLTDYKAGTWTPTVTAASGSITTYTLCAANYMLVGPVVYFGISIHLDNKGTASGSMNITMPYTNGATMPGHFRGREDWVTGAFLWGFLGQSSGTMFLYREDGGSLWTNGYRFDIYGFYWKA
jgi:hypothetical protein